jgi:excisionase family DNA binding protein
MQVDAFLTERQLAARWSVSVRTIQRMVRDGELGSTAIRHSPRFSVSAVEAYEARADATLTPVGDPNTPGPLRSHPQPGPRHQVGADCFTVAVAHLKGGQAKTTTVFFTAWELADKGHRVICRDLDVDNPNLTDAFRDSGAEFDRDGVGFLTNHLAVVPDGAPLPFMPQFELIDTPPAKEGSLQGAARADGIVIPAEPELPAGRSLDKMFASLATVRSANPYLQYIGVVPTRVRRRLSDHKHYIEVMGTIAAEYGFPILEPIPDSRWVRRYSNREHLWRPLADRLIAARRAQIRG